MIAMQRSRYQNKQDMNRAAAHRQKVRLDQQGLGDVYGKMRGGATTSIRELVGIRMVLIWNEVEERVLIKKGGVKKSVNRLIYKIGTWGH